MESINSPPSPPPNQNSYAVSLRNKYEAVRTGRLESPWESTPVNLSEFIRDSEHMNFGSITPKQSEALTALLGEDPLKLFTERKYEIGVFCAGKGSGKDLLSCIALCYVVYVLLHLKNPQLALYKADLPGETIDLVNVAPSAELASYVFFEKLRQRLLHWKWLKKKYKIRMSGKELDPKEKSQPLNRVTIHPRDIMFPKNIRCFSRHSQSDLSEGFNILFAVMDEASAFDDPAAMFSMLETSAKSRFISAFRIFVLSWPRLPEDQDFTLGLVAQAVAGDTTIYALHGAVWEILPPWKYKGETFNFEYQGRILKIPIEFEKDFLEKPEDSLMKYAALAPKVSGGSFYTLPERIEACISLDRLPIAEYEDYIIVAPTSDERVAKRLIKFNIPRQPDGIIYSAHIDHGLKKDSATLTVGHSSGNRAIIDLILEWVPDYTKKRPVDLQNVIDILIELKQKLVNLTYCSADQFQSAQALQALQNIGIVSELKSVNKKVHESVRTAFYSGSVDMLNDPLTVNQLQKLIDYGTKIAAPRKSKYDRKNPLVNQQYNRDDRAIAVTGEIDNLIGVKSETTTVSGNYTSNTEGDKSFSGIGSYINLR